MWPEIPYKKWKDTIETVHLWMEIVGKVKLKFAPFLNQWWEVAFQVSATGITTGNIPYNNEIFQIDFDFSQHLLSIRTSWHKTEVFPLQQQTVKEFYKQCMDALRRLGVNAVIWPVPVEVSRPIAFIDDTIHSSYNKTYVEYWWKILVKTSIIFEKFRSSFRGKSSPIHFFWGSFDLNGTRFSGKKVKPPKMSGVMGNIMHYAENEENFSFGFWMGDERFPSPAFYSYLYPKPAGMEGIPFDGSVSFNEQLGECILPYEDVRKAENPEERVMQFLNSTYEESTKLAKWDIQFFRTEIPI